MMRLHPDLLIQVDDIDNGRHITLEISTAEAPVVVDNSVVLLFLRDLEAHFEMGSTVGRWAEQLDSAHEAQGLWDSLVNTGIIVDNSGLQARYGSADFYHRATRCHPFLDMQAGYDSFVADNAIMREYSEESAQPSVFYDPPYLSEVSLYKASDLSEPQLRVDPLAGPSLILDSTFGSRRHLAGYVDELWQYVQLEAVAKAVPSGGGRHPTEAFILVLKDPIIEPGVYHYSVKHNCLGFVRTLGKPVIELRSAGLQVMDGREVRVRKWVIAMAPMVERSMFRYRESRSFRALPVDIGHLEGHLVSVADYLGYEYRRLRGWDQEAMQELLGADIETLPVLACGMMSQ